MTLRRRKGTYTVYARTGSLLASVVLAVLTAPTARAGGGVLGHWDGALPCSVCWGSRAPCVCPPEAAGAGGGRSQLGRPEGPPGPGPQGRVPAPRDCLQDTAFQLGQSLRSASGDLAYKRWCQCEAPGLRLTSFFCFHRRSCGGSCLPQVCQHRGVDELHVSR